MEEYIKKLKEILGKEKFAQLSNKLFEQVNKRYRRIRTEEGINIVEFNMANILVIGIEKARGCKKEDLERIIGWYNLGPRSFLLEKTLNNFEANYSQYIQLIMKKVKETEENTKTDLC